MNQSPLYRKVMFKNFSEDRGNISRENTVMKQVEYIKGMVSCLVG